MSSDKGMQLARYAIEVARHFAFRLIRRTRGNRAVDRFVLAERSFGPSWLRQQRSTDSLKVGPDRIENLANTRETQAFGHLAVKPGVELVKAFEVSAGDGGLLIGEILAQRCDGIIRHVGCTDPDDLHLQRTAHQHPLPDVVEMDPGDVRAALRLDDNKPLESKPVDRRSDRKLGHFESGAPLVLVDRRFGRESAGYDGTLERNVGLVDFRSSRPASSRGNGPAAEAPD
nr:hypothetical protein [Bradyrhizobium diazoefficiens]